MQSSSKVVKPVNRWNYRRSPRGSRTIPHWEDVQNLPYKLYDFCIQLSPHIVEMLQPSMIIQLSSFIIYSKCFWLAYKVMFQFDSYITNSYLIRVSGSYFCCFSKQILVPWSNFALSSWSNICFLRQFSVVIWIST